ncbi:hypothetical protein Q5P01_025267 [Channa striata]|uniref:Uncharacterized protein n=1 Tax=Channa striata TaxID=64152 RepID=A0AA88IPA9_CHASR|nr:hypothetical protein Q5P01_025267 [Channa striata]
MYASSTHSPYTEVAGSYDGKCSSSECSRNKPGAAKWRPEPTDCSRRRAGLIGQPQFPQFVPALPAYAVQAPVPNMYPAPAYQFPYMGVPQMAPMPQMNPPQQPAAVGAGGAMPQQLPAQPGPMPRFRRQLVRQEKVLKGTVDTQIPTPTDTTLTTLCDEQDRHENN